MDYFVPTSGIGAGSMSQGDQVVAPEVRPVRTVTTAKREAGETTGLTGHVEAEKRWLWPFAFQAG